MGSMKQVDRIKVKLLKQAATITITITILVVIKPTINLNQRAKVKAKVKLSQLTTQTKNQHIPIPPRPNTNNKQTNYQKQPNSTKTCKEIADHLPTLNDILIISLLYKNYTEFQYILVYMLMIVGG